MGQVEEADPLPSETHRLIDSEPQIIQTGFVEDPVPYYHVMDVLAFPTHREGFGNAALEAHAAGKPVVAAWATGVVDSVIDGVTGILVPVGDARALAEALSWFWRTRVWPPPWELPDASARNVNSRRRGSGTRSSRSICNNCGTKDCPFQVPLPGQVVTTAVSSSSVVSR